MINNRIGRRIHGAMAAIVAAAVVAACSGMSSPAAGSPAPAASASGASIELPDGFPIGTWTTTITAEDLLAVDQDALATFGMSQDDLVKENAGVFTTTFAADGTWSTLQESDETPKWPVFRGTFAPVGSDAMDQTTTFPPDFAGDVVRFTWRTENGLLHLAVPEPPDPVLPVVMAAHPWSPAT